MSDLSPVERKLILHWGEMGERWGVNRTVAQIHALLYLSPEPLPADQIAGRLSVSRSSVSTSLKELLGWGIVRVVHVLGDRRDYFESMSDVWEMFRVIVEQRKRRELDPTLAVLRECAAEAERRDAPAHTRERVSTLLDFFETMTAWYEQLRALPTAGVIKLVRLGRRVRSLVSEGS